MYPFSFSPFSVHTLSSSNENQNPRFEIKEIFKVQGVIRPPLFKEGAWGFQSAFSKNHQQESPLFYLLSQPNLDNCLD